VYQGVARDWYGNGAPTAVTGRLEFIQDTALSPTHTLVELQGLGGEASTYHIHEIPVQPQLEFACSGDAVGGHFNPWHWDPANSTAAGTPDQFEAGDLSGKYGLLDNRQTIKEVHNDTNLPMFGATSIVGRSVVVHKVGQKKSCTVDKT
jgi:Cu/Zn superoxide dismutase